jgi:predicted Zn-dependent peptidase
LAFCENLGGYEWFEQYVDRLDQVTRDDVLRVARSLFRKQNRIVGWLVPTGMGEEDEEFDDE